MYAYRNNSVSSNYEILITLISLRLGENVLDMRGHAVAQLVEALRYKTESRGFDPDGVIGIFH